MKKIAMIVLVTAALGFSAAPPAHAWSNFIKHLTNGACQGQSSKFKNGCYSYIEYRVDKVSSPAKALEWAKSGSRCSSWYNKGSNDWKTCVEGATYLYNMGQ